MFKDMLIVIQCALCGGVLAAGEMEKNFLNPPDSARPGVYWYFMDGNLNGKEMTADLESMKAAGLGNLVFLEVDIGEPRGPGRVHEPQVAGAFRPIRPRRGTPGHRHHPRDRAGLVWQRRPLGQAGASHAAPRLQFGRAQRAAELFGDSSPAGAALDRVAHDGQPVLRGCGGLGLPQPQTDHCRHRREGAFRAGVRIPFGSRSSPICRLRHAMRSRGRRASSSRTRSWISRSSSSPTARSTGMSRPGIGRLSAWDAGSRARAAGPPLPPRWAWSATSSTRRRWRIISDQYRRETAGKDRPAREGARLDHPAHG